MAGLTRSGRVDDLNVLNAMSDAENEHVLVQEAARKAQEREEKKAEVRRRLEEAGNKKKAKKGFLTPERKKKLRKLLMVKAAEDLKRQQLAKEQERQKILAERTPKLPEVDNVDDHAKLEAIYNDLFSRMCELEDQKWEINYVVSQTEAQINQMTIEVNDLRGKYVKPPLKKVSKYDNKFKKLAQSNAEKTTGEKKLDFRNQLKVVKKDVMEEISKPKKKDDKPDWSKKGAQKEEAPVVEKEDQAPIAEKEEELPSERHEEEEEEIEEEEEDEEEE